MTPTVAAFFDLDGTLLSGNSGRLWMEREWRLGRLSLPHLLEGLFYLLAYQVHLVNIEAVMDLALQALAGEDEGVVRGWTREWFLSEVVPIVAPGAWVVLRHHRQRGHRLVLLTSSTEYESELACEHFGLEAYMATRFEVEGGRFTGGLVPPACYGEGKVVLAEEFAAREGVSLGESYFYTDSFTDLPMLRRVGHPRVVNPDLRLRVAAWRQGWDILDWR